MRDDWLHHTNLDVTLKIGKLPKDHHPNDHTKRQTDDFKHSDHPFLANSAAQVSVTVSFANNCSTRLPIILTAPSTAACTGALSPICISS